MRAPHIGHVGPEFAAPYVHVQAVNVLLLYSVESVVRPGQYRARHFAQRVAGAREAPAVVRVGRVYL